MHKSEKQYGVNILSWFLKSQAHYLKENLIFLLMTWLISWFTSESQYSWKDNVSAST